MSLAIKGLLIDIEGTVSSISFVKEVLFPYARARFADYLLHQASEQTRQTIYQQVRDFVQLPDLSESAVVEQLIRWSDEDRKIAPLKDLQGLIWQEGYASGELKVELYPDVVPHLQGWRDKGYSLYIYSSGSVLAQKLLFGHTTQGDVNSLFDDYFDTTIGGKLDSNAYLNIARHIGREPQQLLFLSDNFAELNAASVAGVNVVALDRGEVSFPDNFAHRRVTEFGNIAL